MYTYLQIVLNMYTHICIFINICFTYMHIYIHTYYNLHIYICLFTHIYTSIHVHGFHTHTNIHIYIYLFVNASTASTYTYIYIYMLIHACGCTLYLNLMLLRCFLASSNHWHHPRPDRRCAAMVTTGWYKISATSKASEVDTESEEEEKSCFDRAHNMS